MWRWHDAAALRLDRKSTNLSAINVGSCLHGCVHTLAPFHLRFDTDCIVCHRFVRGSAPMAPLWGRWKKESGCRQRTIITVTTLQISLSLTKTHIMIKWSALTLRRMKSCTIYPIKASQIFWFCYIEWCSNRFFFFFRRIRGQVSRQQSQQRHPVKKIPSSFHRPTSTSSTCLHHNQGGGCPSHYRKPAHHWLAGHMSGVTASICTESMKCRLVLYFCI